MQSKKTTLVALTHSNLVSFSVNKGKLQRSGFLMVIAGEDQMMFEWGRAHLLRRSVSNRAFEPPGVQRI